MEVYKQSNIISVAMLVWREFELPTDRSIVAERNVGVLGWDCFPAS